MKKDERAALTAALVEDVAALGLATSASQLDILIAYLDLLQRWNSVYNLTAIRTPGDMLTQHVVDCLAAIGPLEREMGTDRYSVLDVGSGGGMPGLVIAAMVRHAEVTCVDAVGKKAAFVQQAASELGLKNLHSVHARVDQMPPAMFDVVTCRAFGSLETLRRMTVHLLKPSGRWMAMKGHVPNAEIAELPSSIEMFHVEHLDVPRLAAQRCLVWMRPRAASEEMSTL